MRARAVRCGLFYGLAPYWLYEPAPHYGCGARAYVAHAQLNLRLAARWMARRETADDIEFELWNNA